MLRIFLLLGVIGFVGFTSKTLYAQGCDISNRACILKQIEDSAPAIENKSWRDQVLREAAKTYAFDGNLNAALAVIPKIHSPDTKAMTIRGIGMAMADRDLSPEIYTSAFNDLRGAADTIKHPPSYAIALTYIAMSQAFAGDNIGAWATAADMDNDALRYKAYAETAEIQAEKGDFAAAMKSIGYIESEAFKNKAYSITSKILAEGGQIEQSYLAAMNITNNYKRATALQFF